MEKMEVGMGMDDMDEMDGMDGMDPEDVGGAFLLGFI